MSLWSWIKHTAKKVGKGFSSAVHSVGKVVGGAISAVGKVATKVASPFVKAIEYVGEKTGLDKPFKAVVDTIASGVRSVGSAIENSGVVGQAFADVYNATKVVNPFARAVDIGLAGADVVDGKMSVGDALVAGTIGKKLKGFKAGRNILSAGTISKSAQHIKNRHS